MNFNSIDFLIFFPLIVLIFFVLPHRIRWIALLAASYYFYMSWSAELIILILFTTAVSYLAAIGIERSKSGVKKKLLLTTTLVTSLGILFFFKYFTFLSDSLTDILKAFSLPVHELTLQLILPVGISFYTFQTLSYVIDVYRGTIKAERHFGYYALFVSFFPQLVAGPIERPDNLIPQLREKHTPKIADFSAGISKMLIGFFKKVVVADTAAVYVNSVYNDAESATGFGIVIATVLFAFQIYCDFSGYTDIAIGASRVMGIKLMQNFNRPYTAESIKDFWGRWHISLSSWFRDYLYIPLGGSRCSIPRHMFNLFFVFLVSGLWHGAAWTFVLWGAIHGMYQVVGALTKKPREKLLKKLGINEHARWLSIARKATVFILVTFAWIFFRANSMADMRLLLHKLFSEWSLDASYYAKTLDSMGITLIGALTTVASLLLMRQMDATGLCGEEDENGATIIYDVVEDSLNNNGNDFIYDLQGRRVSEPKKGGIYIKNGKKILF